MKPTLSILTPSVWSRVDQSRALYDKIQSQDHGNDVEHLVLLDNRSRSIGAKRQALLDVARGKYVAFVDDDDDITDDYVDEILKASAHDTDVITFWQHATYNGLESTVKFSGKHQDEVFNPGGVTLRNLWHVCAWRRDAVADCVFGESNYGEDLTWCVQARRSIRSEASIDRVLHFYRHDSRTTEAPEPARAEDGV